MSADDEAVEHPEKRRSRTARRTAKAEAARLGLRPGDAHPETGRIFNGCEFRIPSSYVNTRRNHLLHGAARRAKERGLPCTLTREWLDAVWPPNGRCEVLPFIVLTWGREDLGSSPSIDRIRPELGYVPHNCRIISYRANMLKNNASARELELVLADLKQHDCAQ